MAAEQYTHGVAAVAITPGFLRSESMLEGFGVTEHNWREGGKADSNFLASESPLFIGGAVAALAADPKIMERTGQLFSSWGLAREYKFTDADGTRPDWGRTKLDFSMFPPELLSYFQIGTRLSRAWLDTVTQNTRAFMKQLPKERRPGEEGRRQAQTLTIRPRKSTATAPLLWTETGSREPPPAVRPHAGVSDEPGADRLPMRSLPTPRSHAL